MKNLRLAALGIFATAAVTAQDLPGNQVPANLSKTFSRSYPNAKDVAWEMEGVNYKVEFDLGRMEHDVWFSTDGKVLKTERELSKEELPTSIINTLQKKYPEYKVDEVEVTEENGKTTYDVELEKWFSNDIKLTVAEDGTILGEHK